MLICVADGIPDGDYVFQVRAPVSIQHTVGGVKYNYTGFSNSSLTFTVGKPHFKRVVWSLLEVKNKTPNSVSYRSSKK